MNDRETARGIVSLFKAHYSENDVRELSYDLGLDYENLKGRNLSTAMRELVMYCTRRKKLGQLVAVAKLQNPSLAWPVDGSETAVFPTNVHTYNLRQALLHGLGNDQTLATFCEAHFPDMSIHFGAGMSFREKVQVLLVHARLSKIMDKLVAAVQTEYPEAYEQYAPIKINTT
ncbi:MAG: hypothetical protein GY943_04785 [Chloroflexi bacterium]|nr:hypothetical protein [Chloroflexota bacterium]